MARIRTVKPEFFRHVGLYDLEVDSGLPLRIAFAGLWTAADREGRFPWEPRTLKLDVLPHDAIDFSRVLDALSSRGFVVRYTTPEGEFGYIPSWSKHQVINNREMASTLPIPPKEPKQKQQHADASTTRAARVPDDHAKYLSNTLVEGKGNMEEEGKGMEETPSLRSGGEREPEPVVIPKQEEPVLPVILKREKPQKHRLPSDFEPDRAAAIAYWRKKGRDDLCVFVEDQVTQFKAHHRKCGSRMEDWPSAWVTWYSKAPEMTKPQAVPAQANGFTPLDDLREQKARALAMGIPTAKLDRAIEEAEQRAVH